MCTFILFYKNPPSFFSENPPSFLYPKLLYSKFFIHRDIYNYSNNNNNNISDNRIDTVKRVRTDEGVVIVVVEGDSAFIAFVG